MLVGRSASANPHPFAQEVVSLCAVDSCFLKWTISAKLQMGVMSSLSHLRLKEVFLSEAC